MIATEIELSVIVPTLDALSLHLRAMVATLRDTVGVPYELVLLDNGGQPQGFSAPVNAALRAARGEFALIANDDIVFAQGWWPPLREALGHNFVACPLTVGPHMRHDFPAWCFALRMVDLPMIEAHPGQLLDESMKVWGSDQDLLVRLQAMRRPPIIVPESRIAHLLSETIRRSGWLADQLEADMDQFDATHSRAKTLPQARAWLEGLRNA